MTVSQTSYLKRFTNFLEISVLATGIYGTADENIVYESAYKHGVHGLKIGNTFAFRYYLYWNCNVTRVN